MSVSGRILDIQNQPISHAHIQILGSNRGTISNMDGKFRLNLSESDDDRKLFISKIGYKSRVVSMQSDLNKIVLAEDVKELNEVVILPKDHALELVKLAIENIPSNYPNVSERHVGFLREASYWKNKKDAPRHMVEAVVESIKNDYQKKHKHGNVKLLESRKYSDDKQDSLLVKIFSGAHIAHRSDIVARRGAFLSNPDVYDLEIKDTLRYFDKDVFKISFDDKNLEGNIYIIDSSFAISKVELKVKKFSQLDPFDRDKEYHNSVVEYLQTQNIWRLKSINSKTGLRKRGIVLHLTGEYITTNVMSGEMDIPYTERIHFGDFLFDEVKEYNPDFWNDYDIILPDENTEGLFSKGGQDAEKSIKPPTSISKREKLFKVISRLKFGYAVSWENIGVSDFNINYNNSVLDIQHNEAATHQNSLGLSSPFFYELGSYWFLGLVTELPLSKSGKEIYDLSIIKGFNLNPKGRPIVASLGLQIGYQHMRYFIDNYRTESNFQVRGKTFNSGKTDVFLSQKQFHVQPNLMLSVEKSNRTSYYVSVNYNHPLARRTGLTFKEKGQSIFGKRQFLENGDDNLTIESLDNNIFTDNLSVNFGFLFGI